jgi:hypothetical protein
MLPSSPLLPSLHQERPPDPSTPTAVNIAPPHPLRIPSLSSSSPFSSRYLSFSPSSPSFSTSDTRRKPLPRYRSGLLLLMPLHLSMRPCSRWYRYSRFGREWERRREQCRSGRGRKEQRKGGSRLGNSGEWCLVMMKPLLGVHISSYSLIYDV